MRRLPSKPGLRRRQGLSVQLRVGGYTPRCYRSSRRKLADPPSILARGKMKDLIIVDLDGTMCDIGHRRKFVDGSQKKNWEAFYAGLKDDQPNKWCQVLVETLMAQGF